MHLMTPWHLPVSSLFDSAGRGHFIEWRSALPTGLRQTSTKGITMSMGDKIKHTGEEAVGKVKEATGKVTGNESLEARGQAEQAEADVKQAGDSAKDAAKDGFGR